MSDSLSKAPQSKRNDHETRTPHGTARVDLALPPEPAGLVVLGHGAGGDSQARVLVAVSAALQAAGIATALIDQPYRVAGRRAPDPADRLDAAMTAVVADLATRLPGVPLMLGGKSSGARVGCRTSAAVGAVGVVALGFPLVPPGRPDRSRAGELAAGCPVLVVQGTRDSFGSPDDVRRAAAALPVTVHEIVGGDHSFAARRADPRTTAECIAEVAAVVTSWCRERFGP